MRPWIREPRLDHIIIATPDLLGTLATIRSLTGATPRSGGQHPGQGTINYLLGIGSMSYLEIIGIGPGQQIPAAAYPLYIQTLTAPQIMTWALRSEDISADSEDARRQGYDPGKIAEMSRRKPSGELITWRMTVLDPQPRASLIPFLIEWGDTAHPSRGLPRVGLLDFHGQHPDPQTINSALTALGGTMTVSRGPTAQLSLTLEGPEGTYTI